MLSLKLLEGFIGGSLFIMVLSVRLPPSVFYIALPPLHPTSIDRSDSLQYHKYQHFKFDIISFQALFCSISYPSTAVEIK